MQKVDYKKVIRDKATALGFFSLWIFRSKFSGGGSTSIGQMVK